MQQTFAATIQTRADRLTPLERKLVSSVLAQPRNAALAVVTDLARGAGLHDATVSRLELFNHRPGQIELDAPV